jgi:hypothetical protein
MPVVFCKPDALDGPHSRVEGERAAAMLMALAVHCLGGDGRHRIPAQWKASADRAALQVAERAATEPSFRGSLTNARAVANRLDAAADTMKASSASTRHVLMLALDGLGFTVRESARLVLGESGVDLVYGHGVTTTDYWTVRSDLMEYLAECHIEVWTLAASQEECALQWWKTYARQMLLNREPGMHLLRNLVHVCEGPDAVYLVGRLTS